MAEALPDFDVLAREYARYRTGYSQALFDLVLAAAPPRPRALDLAAGTGLSARGLAPHASRLVVCDAARRMLAASPVGDPVVARAEALPFRDAAFDLVTVAQAFHWMAPLPTYRELRRVLAPGGVAAIWWKYPQPTDPTRLACDAAFERVVGAPAPHTPLVRDPLPSLDEAPFRRVEERVVPCGMAYTVDAWIGYQASREILRRGAGPLRETVLARMREAVAALHPDGRFTVAYDQRLVLLHA